MNKTEMLTLAPIVGASEVSICCGADIVHPPEYEDEGIHYYCDSCDKETEGVPAWTVLINCPDHGRHTIPVPASTFSLN